MADTQTAAPSIIRDARVRYQLTPAAVEEAKRRLNTDNIATLGAQLGYTRQTFWRLRTGKRGAPLSEALVLAERIGLAFDKAFKQAPRG
ncbi:hypothetical protein ACH4T9_12265 [Micromonospora sp. NPDC020750]|uniref:hypothetical protein n=1 Tax=unclassified Micromonospora TaxID=2617518 RepID=UPI0037985F3B